MNVIYTAIFGPYDELKHPLVVTPGWKYICFTDQFLQSSIWDIKRVSFSNLNQIESARLIKIKWFSDLGEKSIWIDATFTINCDLNKFWEENFISPFTVIQHPLRNCIYNEFTACINNGRGDNSAMIKQRLKYLEEGLPHGLPLIQSGILLRENKWDVIEFCDLWWDQIQLSTRDQIGFAYAEWKTGIRWPRIENFDYRKSDKFIFKTHFHRRRK